MSHTAKTNVFFDFRYHKSISVAELYKINDTIEIREQGGAGRMVYLLSSPQRTPSPEEGTDTEVRDQRTGWGGKNGVPAI